MVTVRPRKFSRDRTNLDLLYVKSLWRAPTRHTFCQTMAETVDRAERLFEQDFAKALNFASRKFHDRNMNKARHKS